MLQKISLLIVLYLTTTTSIIGQSITWGEKIKENPALTFTTFLGKTTEGIQILQQARPFSMASMKSSYQLLTLDNSMNIAKSKDVGEALATESFGDYLCLVQQDFERQGLFSFGVTSLSLDLRNNDQKLVKTLDLFSPTVSDGASSKPKRSTIISSDGSKMAVIADNEKIVANQMMSKEARKASLKYWIASVDVSSDILFKKEIDTKVPNSLCEFYDVAIGNDGNIFCLYETFKKKRQKVVKKNANSTYFLVKHNKNKDQELGIVLEEKIILDAKLIFNSTGNIILAGLYSDANEAFANGYFSLEIDATTLKIIKTNHQPFSESTYKNWKRIGAKLKTIRSEVKEISLNEDGSIIVVGQQVVAGRETSTGAQARSIPVDYCGNIIIFKIKSNGSFDWDNELYGSTGKNSVIPGKADNMKVISQSEQVYIIFEANNEYWLSSIDTKGKLSTKELYSAAKYGNLSPMKTHVISKNEVLLFTEKNENSFFYGLLKL